MSKFRRIIGGGMSLCGVWALTEGTLNTQKKNQCENVGTRFAYCSDESTELFDIKSRLINEYKEWLRRRSIDTTNIELRADKDGGDMGCINASLSSAGRKVASRQWYSPSKIADVFKGDPVLVRYPTVDAISCDSVGSNYGGHPLEGDTRVIVHLLIEKLKGKNSSLNPWIAMLPKRFSLPACWTDGELEWLRGTSLYRGSILMRKEVERSWEELKPVCQDIARTEGLERTPDFKDFLWATAAFQSLSVPLPHREKDYGYSMQMLPGTEIFRPSPKGDCKWEIKDGGKSLCVLCSRKKLHSKQGNAPLTLSVDGDLSMEQLIFQYGIVEMDPKREVLMIHCPIPPPDLWDVTLKKRLAILVEKGLGPQIFLSQKHYDSLEGSQTAHQKNGMERQKYFEKIIPPDVLKTLEIFVMDADELGQIGRESENNESELQLKSSGMRMAVMTTMVRLLELKLDELQNEESGTGTLESDERLFKAILEQGGTEDRHYMVALCHRMAQKALNINYLKLYSDFLQEEMRYLHEIQSRLQLNFMRAPFSVSRRRLSSDQPRHSLTNDSIMEKARQLSNPNSFSGKTSAFILSVLAVLFLVVGLRIIHVGYGSESDAAHGVDLMDYFVKVEEGRFVVGPSCNLFYVSGFNMWEGVEQAAGVLRLYGASLPQNMTGQQLLRSQLRKAQKYGFNLIRTWANPVSLEYTLMDSPGSYNEMMFRGLDYFLDEARKHDIRVVLNLIDNWQEAGGIPQFQGFANIDSHEDFFQNENAWKIYAEHVRSLLLRRNSINGRLYKDDPVIFSWELINEPRCAGCPAMVLDTWISSMASFVKSIDPNHLLTVGEEGFFSNETPQQGANPSGNNSWAGDQGQNFITNHADKNIDYSGIHMWIQNWEEATVDFANRWLGEHIKQSKKIGKPLIMSEFGAWGNTPKMIKIRDQWYRQIYDMILENAMNRGPFQGGLFWQWFALGQKAPAEEGGSAGGVFGVFENETSFEIALNFTKDIQKINQEYIFDGICSEMLSEPASPVQDCRSTWVRGIPDTGYEGSNCTLNINECARSVHDCDPNAECIDEVGSFTCTCHAGFSGNGQTCERNHKKVDEIFGSFQSQGPGQMACNQGDKIMYKPGYPGYMYDGTVEQERQPVLYESSTREVSEQECMTACRMAGECNAFTFDILQKRCFLHHIDVSSADICPQPPTYCVAIRGKPYECSFLETYFDTTKFTEQAIETQEIKRRTVRENVLEAYHAYINRF